VSPEPIASPGPWSRLAAVFFGLDPRSLALFRVGLAVLLLADLAGRWPDLEAHYSDAGVLPRAITPAYVPFPIHFLGGSAAFEGVLFALAALLAVALLVGYRTTPVTFFSWLMLLSLHARNPLVLHAGDLLERMLLFWSMFLPLGACWSLDARRRTDFQPVLLPGRVENPSYVSVATAALMLQVVFMYWFGLAARTHPAWWGEGTAVADALSLDFYATPLGVWARGLPPELLRFATFATVAVEGGGPLLLLFSGGTGRLRTAVVAVMIAFHILLGLGLRLGTFPLACIVAWLPFLPASFWDGLLSRLRRLLRRPPEDTSAEAAGAPAPPALSTMATTLVVVSFVYVVLCNVNGLLNGFTLSLVRGVGVEQSWGMFAPFPNRDDGWYVVVGREEDGKEVDPFRGAPVSWEKPQRISALYPSVRWAAYLLLIHQPGYTQYAPFFAKSLLVSWNERHGGGEALKSVQVYYMLRFIQPDHTATEPKKELLAEFEPAPAAARE
jgi:hypothetical protein